MKNKTFLILTFIIISIVTVFVVAYLNINTAYNNSKASTPDTNPNFKYFAIIGGDSYTNGWSSPVQIDENLSLSDQNLQNVMFMIFNPRISDPAAYKTYFNNYATEARKRNNKLFVDTFMLTAGQDPSTFGSVEWQSRNQWKLDIYKENKDVIYAFSTDEPSNYVNEINYRNGYINLTKRLRELLPEIGILAIEFRPFVTDHYDSEFHKYVTDIGFDAYDNYWANQLNWFSSMERNVELDKKLWLVPQGYIPTSVPIEKDGRTIPSGNIVTPEKVKEVMKQHIDYAKSNSRYVGIIPFNWSISMNGHNEQAVACIKEMIDPNSQYYTPGYKELIQQTVLELKAKSGIINNTPTPTPTSLPTTKTPTTTASPQTTATPTVQSKFPVVINYNQGTKVAVKQYNCDTRKIVVTVCDSSNYNGKVLTRAWLVDQNNNRNFLYAAIGQDEIDSSYEKSFCGGITGHSYEYTVPTNMELGKLQIVAWDVNSDGNTDWNKYEFPNNMPACESKTNITSTATTTSKTNTTTETAATSKITTPKPTTTAPSVINNTTQPASQNPVKNLAEFPVDITFGNNAKARITSFNCSTKEINGIVCDMDNYTRKVLTRMWLVNDSGRRDYFAARWVDGSGDSSQEKSFCGDTTEHSFSVTIPENISFSTQTDKLQLVTWDILSNGMTDFNAALFPNKTISCK